MTLDLSRRGFLSATVGLSALAPLPVRAQDKPAPLAHEPFSFLFITDTHIEPELNAMQGCARAFAAAGKIGGDFAIQGGDHVFDALGVGRSRAVDLMSLYTRTEQDLGMKVHHTIGNHDLFGIYAKDGATPTDPLYGKKYFQDRFGALYYSFDHRGVHFVVLDSIAVTADHDYEGRVDAAQIAWLADDLRALPAGMPVVVISHVPLASAFASYAPADDPVHKAAKLNKYMVANAYDVIAVLAGYNVIGVLQGHLHINETIIWRGIPFMTRGAVCGNWWRGVRYDTAEGFSVVRVENGRLTTRYETYGFHAVA
ncbi:MAG: metallophosphoesterase family protein, partial [Caulobacteraceae bacterium]